MSVCWILDIWLSFYSNGKFGACFQPALCKQSDLVIYAARPGLRLWRTDVRGRVGETHVLKPLFNQDLPQFELFPRSGPNGGYRPSERQLGMVSCFLKEGWVLSWNEYSVYVVDCTNQVWMHTLNLYYICIWNVANASFICAVFLTSFICSLRSSSEDWRAVEILCLCHALRMKSSFWKEIGTFCGSQIALRDWFPTVSCSTDAVMAVLVVHFTPSAVLRY